MNKKCIGCGITLQTKNKNKLGFISEAKYQEGNYCERCFKVINYNEFIPVNLENINEYIINEVNEKAKLVFFLIDLLNINEETIETFNKIKTKKYLVISKSDVIPKSIKEEKLNSWLKEIYNITEEVFFISAKKKYNINKIFKLMEEHDCIESYVLGFTNSGKSSLINTINAGVATITTSNMLNTTIDFIKMNIDGKTIIDSPGFNYQKTLFDNQDFDLIKRMNPRKFLKPTTLQTKDNLTMKIENLFSLKVNNKNSLTFYISNDINITKFFNYSKEEDYLELEIPENSDLVIKGLGFVNIKKECILNISSNIKDLIEIRKSMF